MIDNRYRFIVYSKEIIRSGVGDNINTEGRSVISTHRIRIIKNEIMFAIIAPRAREDSAYASGGNSLAALAAAALVFVATAAVAALAASFVFSGTFGAILM